MFGGGNYQEVDAGDVIVTADARHGGDAPL